MISNQIKTQIKKLKSSSGTHSPSIDTILSQIPEISIKVDACFLSNPYATELFLKYLQQDLISTNKLKEVLEYYPPQNIDVAKNISKVIKVDYKNIFVGNGAIEIIQSIIHRFTISKICVIIPTFSSYYEFAKPEHEVIYYKLYKENNYLLNVDEYIEFIKKHKPDTIVIINPNNPNGAYISQLELLKIIENLPEIKNFVIDESFIHFAYEDMGMSQITSEELITKYENLIIIKSMSKDFGIAGIRAGYAVMNEKKVSLLLKNGYLWNVSGLANYFFKIYGDSVFIENYEVVRKKYIMNTLMFSSELNSLPGIKTYPSKANFLLLELLNGVSSFDFAIDLLVKFGVYVRDCSDKIGLDGSFIRVASRSFEENLIIIDALKHTTKKE